MVKNHLGLFVCAVVVVTVGATLPVWAIGAPGSSGTSNGFGGLASDPSGILDASPERKIEVVRSIEGQENVLKELKRSVVRDRNSGVISSAVAAQKTREIKDSRDVLLGAKSLLSEEFSLNASASLEPEQLKRQTEALRWITRPVLALCKGAPWAAEVSSEWAQSLNAQKLLIEKLSAAVGLVTTYDVLKSGQIQRRQEAGTAVVIGVRYVVTNKHVIREASLGFQDLITGEWKLFSSTVGQIEFPKEYARCPNRLSSTAKVRIVGIAYADPDPKADYIVLVTDADLPEPVQFSNSPDVVDSDKIAVIGYPGRPSVEFLQSSQIDLIFETPDRRVPFPIERVSLGYTLPEDDKDFFSYDATTWGGSSGSLVVNLVNGQVIGLHAEGLSAPKQGVGYNRAVIASKIAAWQQRAAVLSDAR